MDLSDPRHISVRIIPFDTNGFAGANYSMLHAGGPVPRLDTVQLDAPVTGVQLDADAQLNRYRLTFHKMREASLNTAQSHAFIHRMLQEL